MKTLNGESADRLQLGANGNVHHVEFEARTLLLMLHLISTIALCFFRNRHIVLIQSDFCIVQNHGLVPENIKGKLRLDLEKLSALADTKVC